ncbi:hypothetical protein Ahy_B02g057212 [Arachis hypogaea]|uniref:Uncharacterized protein n=1 Tax=Arachis hypogaea TaxID=3818 RepID=A0A445AB99_ARAHY|nr:hypothetical protein Ahy_B02g057212 [Arachis hypogaea]
MTSMNVPEPVMSLAVQPVSKDSGGQKEDPTFRVGLDPESGQVDATIGKPHVNFRLLHNVLILIIYTRSNLEGKVNMDGYIKPLRAGSPTKFEFENLLVGQAIPSGFIPAIEKGFKEAANS